MKNFNERLKQAMQLKKITQSELCEITGIPKSAMSQYVSGAFAPKQKRTYLIAKALDVNEAWLLGYDVPIERAKNNAEQIFYDFAGINQLLSDFPITDKNILNTQTISEALQKTMEINNMFLSTPRLYIPCIDLNDAIIGLKFILAFFRMDFQNYEDDSLGKIINSSLFKDFIKNIIADNAKKESDGCI